MRKKYSLIGEITDFDYHGFWGDYCSPKSLKAFLDTLSADDVAEIEINSPGGSVIQGVEMANAIKNCKAKIIAHVVGIAASMASVIACACDEIEMEEASFMMIHDPWGYTEGNAEEMRKQASVLDQMKTIIMSFYRGKFKNRTEEEISALMSDETWYTGAECKENGLDCTVIASDVRAAASIVGHKFAKIPDGAKKYLDSKELTDEGRAEIEAARNKAKAETAAESSTQNKNEVGDWEARYKGASKKINELQAKLDKAMLDTVDYGTVCQARDAANKALQDFNDQVKQAGYENLAALIGAVSDLTSKLETSAKDLADSREQLQHMKETRDLLTGSVLSPSNAASKYSTFAEAVDDIGYVAACQKYPELKASYRNKKK
ncbi:MAG: ATP-dependent Clp protease proteolytic subunit [Kiritimatiellae bacterium]|nr:ATP-dependent Clp protease proteolytic subunit [Kiritimatiellia bacterium]